MRLMRNLEPVDRATARAWLKGVAAFYGALALLLVATATAWHVQAPKGLRAAFDSVAELRLQQALQDTRALHLSQLR